MHGLNKIWPIITVVLLFIVSILLRVSFFNISPLEDSGYTQFARWNNTEVWLHDKYVLDVYSHYPIEVHKFAPYVGGDPLGEFATNKKDHSLAVYTSFPSAHFVVLFSVLGAFNSVNFFGMQMFSLVLHLICLLLVLYLAWILTRNRVLSVFAASIYIFSTNTLWNHMNVYWAHQLLMPVFLLALIVFVKQKGMFKWWQGALLGLIMSLITWTGVVATVGFVIYGLYKFSRTKQKIYLNYLYMLGGIVLALAFIIGQILFTTGINPYDYAIKVIHRAHARSLDAKSMPLPVMIWQFINGLVLDYGGYALIAFALSIKKRLKGSEWAILFVSAFPILESFILIEHDTVYSFGRLKWVVPIIVLICILGNKVHNKTKLFISLTAAGILHCLICLAIYLK